MPFWASLGKDTSPAPVPGQLWKLRVGVPGGASAQVNAPSGWVLGTGRAEEGSLWPQGLARQAWSWDRGAFLDPRPCGSHRPTHPLSPPRVSRLSATSQKL